MQTTFSAPGDWDDEEKQTDEEDLGALGMSVKDGDDEIEEEEETSPLPAATVEEEPLDGLAALEKMEAELKDDEPEIDVGEEE
jgi:hypothetical protein